jgi:hypothetical protein
MPDIKEVGKQLGHARRQQALACQYPGRKNDSPRSAKGGFSAALATSMAKVATCYSGSARSSSILGELTDQTNYNKKGRESRPFFIASANVMTPWLVAEPGRERQQHRGQPTLPAQPTQLA